MLEAIRKYSNRKGLIYPLITFRVLFGLMMFLGTLRFYFKGWIEEFYVSPKWHFTYFGFDWVKPLPENGMYLVFLLMGVSFLFISLGLFYRIATITAFTTFTYVELIDKTYYLNHYYFVSLVLFLLIFVPANAQVSLDSVRRPAIRKNLIPAWCLDIFKIQIIIVYFFAGLAKINAEWLFEAMPLKIWLKSFIDLPLIGGLFKSNLFAYVMSWGGAMYDLFIPFLLLSKRFRTLGFLLVLFFHLMTAFLFPIGMFPYIMIVASLIFFPVESHRKLWSRLLTIPEVKQPIISNTSNYSKLTLGILTAFFAIQLAMPFRHLMYPGNIFWTEQGYRFSWRVMLMEKAGYAIFEVSDTANDQKWEVNNLDHLTPVQEKMMSTQGDMIVQFADLLQEEYRTKGYDDIEIRVKLYVSLNGRPSQLMITPEVNLLNLTDDFSHKDWIKKLDSR